MIKIGPLKTGDICRARCTAPARYLQDGLCLFVSAQDNDLGIDVAAPATGGEDRLPLPSDDHVEGARVALGFKGEK